MDNKIRNVLARFIMEDLTAEDAVKWLLRLGARATQVEVVLMHADLSEKSEIKVREQVINRM